MHRNNPENESGKEVHTTIWTKIMHARERFRTALAAHRESWQQALDDAAHARTATPWPYEVTEGKATFQGRAANPDQVLAAPGRSGGGEDEATSVPPDSSLMAVREWAAGQPNSET